MPQVTTPMKWPLLTLATSLALITTCSASSPASKRGESRFETKFMEDMIDHHHMAIMMAAMCEDRAVHEDLLELCQQIQTSQSSQIEQMRNWLEEWYDVNHEPEMSRQMQRQMSTLARLDGEEFEITFMELMIDHHKTAVKEGQKCERKAYHDELLALCDNIVNTQGREIELMQFWLCEWYYICD